MGQTHPFALCQVLGHKLIEQPTVNIVRIVAKQRARLKRLPHLLEEHGQEHALETLSGVLQRCRALSVQRSGRTKWGAQLWAKSEGRSNHLPILP